MKLREVNLRELTVGALLDSKDIRAVSIFHKYILHRNVHILCRFLHIFRDTSLEEGMNPTVRNLRKISRKERKVGGLGWFDWRFSCRVLVCGCQIKGAESRGEVRAE